MFYFSNFIFYFLLFRATPAAYGSYHARGQIGATGSIGWWPTPQPQQHKIQATSVTYTTAHSNAVSLAHWARPGKEPASPWILVGLATITVCHDANSYIFFFFVLLIRITPLKFKISKRWFLVPRENLVKHYISGAQRKEVTSSKKDFCFLSRDLLQYLQAFWDK